MDLLKQVGVGSKVREVVLEDDAQFPRKVMIA
jgi:hypothetical protein